jgi:hypothetical protein
MKFYPADWRSDPKLRMCSAGARGIWIDLMTIMHEADPYGHLVINGVNPTNKQLAGLLGETPGQVKKWLAELEQAAVFSRTDDGVIYSRRMVRDNQRSEQGREHGKGGGNPQLTGKDNRQRQGGIRDGVNPPDNPPANGRDNASRARVPDARGQRVESREDSAPNGAAHPGGDPDAELYQRARQVIGPKHAGAVVSKLKTHFGGSIPRARAAVEQASEKARPKDWLMGIVNKREEREDAGSPFI